MKTRGRVWSRKRKVFMPHADGWKLEERIKRQWIGKRMKTKSRKKRKCFVAVRCLRVLISMGSWIKEKNKRKKVWRMEKVCFDHRRGCNSIHRIFHWSNQGRSWTLMLRGGGGLKSLKSKLFVIKYCFSKVQFIQKVPNVGETKCPLHFLSHGFDPAV